MTASTDRDVQPIRIRWERALLRVEDASAEAGRAKRGYSLARSLKVAILVALALLTACMPPPPRPTYAIADRGVDTDEDGIADADDACPSDPEDGLPPKANDGCPADDPDHDGIGRLADRCPLAKEDHLPPNPTDGCPTNDTDQDGVADALDKCPDALEDNLQPDPSDGCPAADPDRDGIAGAADRCPNAPETYNGFQDEDGCPDTVPETRTVVFDEMSSTIYIPESIKIDFELGSANLTATALATIKEVARVLSAHPEISRVEVEGHASTVGPASSNLALTQSRAFAVTTALVAAGVSAERLFPIGYGELCNAIDLGDETDDARNRRVVLKAVVISGVWQSVPRGCWRAEQAGISAVLAKPTSKGPPQAQVLTTQGGGV